MFEKAITYHLCSFKDLQNHLNQSIQAAKQNYVNKIAQKLGDANNSNKCYLSLLKTLLTEGKFPVFLLYFIVINILLTLKIKVSFLFLFSLFSFFDFLRFQKKASYLLNYHYGQIAHYFFVN